jgi:Transposase DDE domain/Insertion element 4 transposase N-terminal
LRVHDASSRDRAPARGEILARCGAGLLSWFVPPGLVAQVTAQARAESDAAIAAAGGTPARPRVRALPPVFGVYVVLGLCLTSSLSHRKAAEGLVSVMSGALKAAGWVLPSGTAFTRMRRRLGTRPFELLFWLVAGVLLPGTAEWSHICGLLAVAWDGTTFQAADTPANRAGLGRQQDSRPRARLVALVACGTRAVLGAAPGPMKTGERALAARLTGCLQPGMLLLADRGFYSWALWNQCTATGAQLLWRVSAGTHLPVARRLPDGSWLTVIHDPREKQKRAAKNGCRRRRGSTLPPDTSPLPGKKITARVIEFTVTVTPDEGKPRTEPYRMITTLHDWQAYPAAELAAAYARRWAVETAFRELKTCLRGPGRVLRPATPDLVIQEIWAYLITYQAIRAVIARAAAGSGLAPARISFTGVLASIRAAAGTPASHAAALDDACESALADLVQERPGRICARVLREPEATFPRRKKNTTTPLSQHATITVTITPRNTPPPTTTDQHKQTPETGQPSPLSSRNCLRKAVAVTSSSPPVGEAHLKGRGGGVGRAGRGRPGTGSMCHRHPSKRSRCDIHRHRR